VIAQRGATDAQVETRYEVLKGWGEVLLLRGQYDAAEQKLAASLPAVPLGRLADHIDHIVRVAGIDHVGLGSDFDGMELAPAGMEDVSCFPNLTIELLRRGYSEQDIRKILGENFLRVLGEAEQFVRRSQRSEASKK